MEITAADEATSELSAPSTVEEELRSALQEIEELRAQIGMLLASEKKSKNRLRSIEALVDDLTMLTNDWLSE